jgi:hypothetical protein
LGLKINVCSAILSLGSTIKNVTPYFSRTHQMFKNRKKHLNEHFHKIKKLNTFIRFHRFLNLNNIKKIVYFDVPNHCI